MALIDDVRGSLHITSKAMDGEIQALINGALADMERAGIAHSYLTEYGIGPMEKCAVIFWCKSMFGFDNSDSDRFMDAYKATVEGLKNSDHNTELLK